MHRRLHISYLRVGTALIVLASAVAASGEDDFDQAVRPVLTRTCVPCHNERLASGGLNLKTYGTPEAIARHREQWEAIVQKIRSGEMPPRGIPKPPPEQLAALMNFVELEFEKADQALAPDPGSVTARRLNRAEYSNTIRDLLGVSFRAENDFPTDDSGHGFDNIGDVLTISPVLMEKYLDAAELIASIALGADPLPARPVEAQYHSKDGVIRRPDVSTVEAVHRVGWGGEYQIRIGLPGERPPGSPPATLGFWMDGELVHTTPVETQPSGLVYFEPYSEAEFRLYLPPGDHTFRAGFLNDEYVKGLSRKEAFDRKKNKYPTSITFIGPYPSNHIPPSRKKILICDPHSGPACVDRILTKLARRAYRRPVAAGDIEPLRRFVDMAAAEGQTIEQGLQLALQAILVSPHFLFRVERTPEDAATGGIHRISPIELASRLSYFLWSSMPDEELLALGESGRLQEPEVLEAQVARMLADPRSAALAENFAGQWLEIRALDSVKPDPERFPDWGPELREAMRTETRLFFEAVLRENLPLSTFLDANFTFLNERLAKHYGIDGVEGPDFRRVALRGGERGGILSQASVLTVSSYPTRTSPVIRGKYVLENILGAPPPPPPPDVPALNEAAVGNAGSLRQQMEQHRSNPACASCHVRMDAIGFGLENYDAIGRWRVTDGKFPIDAAGVFPNGKSFTTPAGLRALLLDDLPEFARCVTEKMLTYALGRGLERYDRPAVRAVSRKLAAADYRFQALIYEVVRSLPFQMRRAGPSPDLAAGKPKEVARR